MIRFMQPDKDPERLAHVPEEVAILPLRNTVAYPFSVLPLTVGIPRSVKLVEDAMQGHHVIGLVSMKNPGIDEPQPGETFEIGTVAEIHRVLRAEEKDLRVIVEGLERFRIRNWVGTDPYLRARIELKPDVFETGAELDALIRTLRNLAQDVVSLLPNVPKEAGNFLEMVDDPRYLTYLVATNARLDMEHAQKLLEMENLSEKLRMLIEHLGRARRWISRNGTTICASSSRPFKTSSAKRTRLTP
jgi:ATP-dependent Lon protease